MARRIKKSEVLKALQLNNGNKTAAGRSLGCTRQTIHNFCKKYPEIEAVMEEQREIKLDALEEKAWSEAMNGNTAVLLFMLKTQGHRRGYRETTSIDINQNKPIVIDWGDGADEGDDS